MKDVPRCKYCSAPLPWPFVPLSPGELKLIVAIRTLEKPVRNSKMLGKLVQMSDARVRSLIHRINGKLEQAKSNYVILKKPYRVVEIVELQLPL